VDRQPPAFSEDSLAYDWDMDEPESKDLEEKVPDEKSEVLLPLKKLAKGPIDRKLKAPKKGARRFRILHDSLSKRNYAAELSTVDGIPHARLYLAAKGKSYDPIWYNANRAEESKSSKTKPRGDWLPWTIVMDSTWKPVGPETTKIELLHKGTVKSNRPPAEN
jgi:hypothetical protein